jgi:DNA repair protein SbcC/Rad50
MQITQIDLDNVKSYRRASISFTEGTNAICGPNGAGKSTLLESIGFVLFDVLPYSQSQFVREGEKTATVTIHLVGSDGRAYQVVRKCGSYSQYYVYDPEIDQKLTTNKGETVDWLYDFLGVEESGDLSVLFKDAVGVPQGLLTSAFLLTPTNRKGTFDPLLRVDEYKQVWDALLEPRRHLEKQITAEEKRIAGFEAEVKALPGWQAKASDLQAKVQSDAGQQEATQAELEDVTRRKGAMEAVKERLDALEKSATRAEGEVKALGAQLKDAQTAVEQAERAQVVVDETEAGHQTYLIAQANLEALEKQRKQRDSLREAFQKQTTELALAEQRVNALEVQLEHIEAAEAEIEALRPQVETQERLESQRNKAQRAADRLADGERNLTQERDRLADLEANLVEVRKDLKKLARVEGELESLRGEVAALDTQWEALRVQITGQEVELGQLDEQSARIADRVANAAELLKQERSRLADLEAKLSQVRVGLAELADVEQRGETLRRELEDLDAQREALASETAAHRAELNQVQAQTDILEAAETAQCPVCAGPLTPEHRADLLARNRVRQEELAAALQAAQAGQDKVIRTWKRKQKALDDLERRAKELPRPGEKDEVTAQIEAQKKVVSRSEASLVAEQAEASAHKQRRAEVEAALAELRPQGDEAQKARDRKRQAIEGREETCKELPRPAEEKELSARIEAQRKGVKELESLVAELAGAPAEVERLAAELAALGDPRRNSQRAAVIADRRDDVEKDLAETGERISGLNGRIGEIERDLVTYMDLDERLEAERQVLEAQEADHQRYLGHVREAETLSERRDKVETLTAGLETAQTERERLVVERDGVAAGYDAQTYATLAGSYQALRDELVTLEERLRQQRVQLREARAEIERLTGLQGQLKAAHAEHGELTEILALLEHLRRVLRDAGPKVTKALVEVISLQAARLYADIMADHTARLQWTEEYEILLTTGGRERTFQQLSGGEQMASALAVRLALLREVSDIDVAFFDEPTANLDEQRRDNLAEQILNIKGFSQLFVISHDDTFERDTDHVVRVVKENGVSRVED